MGAATGKREGHRAAEAARCAGHEGNPAVEREDPGQRGTPFTGAVS
jgi:hypothetical protein